LGNVVRGSISDLSTAEGLAEATSTASIRVAPNTYLAALFVATFFTAYFVYVELDALAAGIFLGSWIINSFLYFKDRIVFDGEQLRRSGLLPRLWNRLAKRPDKIEFRDIEQIETQALRAFRRGGKVFYRYRTSVHSRNQRFIFASGGEDFRKMVTTLFARVSDDVLDNRSIELRDYLRSPNETRKKLERERFPSSEVLEHSVGEFTKRNRARQKTSTVDKPAEVERTKSKNLRELANELRMTGNLVQALEAFRRALHFDPNDPWLLFEFGRCLHSYAGLERNDRLKHRANAVLRLAESRANYDSTLLSRLGESYFQYGDWDRARFAFQKALNSADESFRSLRGLAEIALREGKIAHVIHHFAAAFHLTETAALKRWAIGETAYFTRLNNDDEYLEAEIRRINWLDGLERGKKMSLRFMLFGSAFILFGMVSNELFSNLGWAIASVSLLLWIGFVLSSKFMSERTPLTEIESGDSYHF